MDLNELTEHWREEGARLEALGVLVGARVFCHCADDLEAFVRRTVTTAEAATLSGYTEGQLRELARQGQIEAFKQSDEWRFVVSSLPKKPPRKHSVGDELAERRRAAR